VFLGALVSIAFWFPGAAMLYASVGIYALGPNYADVADDRICVLGVSLAAIWVALGTNLVGLQTGKWTENFGAVCGVLLWVLMCAIALLVWSRHGTATPIQILPAWNGSESSQPNRDYGAECAPRFIRVATSYDGFLQMRMEFFVDLTVETRYGEKRLRYARVGTWLLAPRGLRRIDACRANGRRH
jgi:hypothetical protein